MNRERRAISLQQATQESPTLARLFALADESSQRLRSIQPLLPAALRSCVRAGPIEGSEWCLLLSHNAAASKLRQLLPALLAHLRSKGWPVETIRLRIQTQLDK